MTKSKGSRDNERKEELQALCRTKPRIPVLFLQTSIICCVRERDCLFFLPPTQTKVLALMKHQAQCGD